MADRPDTLTGNEFERELRTDSILQTAINAQMYFTYRAVVRHSEFPRLLYLYKKRGTKTKSENAEYDYIHNMIFKDTYALFEIIDFALNYHSKVQ